MCRSRPISQIIVVALGVVIVAPAQVRGQDVCGMYETAPGSVADYSYHDGTLQTISIPVSARFDISCQDFQLDAVIKSPIIGVDENGNELFPTGLTYPLGVTAAYDGQLGYTGMLLNTQYGYQWSFAPSSTGATWSGAVFWSGGRFEETDIQGVPLLLVPEPTSGAVLLLSALLGSLCGRCDPRRPRAL